MAAAVPVDRLDPLEDRAAHHDAARHRQHQGREGGPGETVQDHVADGGAVLDVAPDQKMEIGGEIRR